MVDWHVVEFGIPKLSSLTDEQLEGLYVDRLMAALIADDQRPSRARASLPLAELAKTYWKHHNEAVSCRAVYRSLLAKCGGNEQRAWTRLNAYYANELAGLEEPEGWLDFLLSEADRIRIDDPFRLPSSVAG